jgi:hypothetical protein
LTLLREAPARVRVLGEVTGAARHYRSDALILRWLREQLNHCDAIGEYLAPAALNTIVAEAARRPQEEIDLLFTLTATIEDLVTGASVLERDP